MTDKSLTDQIDKALGTALKRLGKSGEEKLTVKEEMSIINSAIKWEAVKNKLAEGTMGSELMSDDDDEQGGDDDDP